jgi:CopG family nickel-responsive transcriptional regulator
MSLSKKLLNEFDEVLNERGYNSRSKGIRDALKDYIIRYHWMKNLKGDKIGIITVIYDHYQSIVLEDLANIQHRFRDYINSTMHIHMTENKCLEIIVVKGAVLEIRNLTEQIMRLKGVEYVKLTTADSQ